MYRRKKVLWSSLAILAVISALAIYAGLPIYAKLWHVVNGNSVRCGGFTVPVPDGWWARNGGCSLVTPSPAYTVRIQHPAQIFLNLTPAPSVRDNRWRQAMLDQRQIEGDTLRRTTELTVAGSQTMCFEYDAPSTSSNSIIACDVDGRMVVNFFFNDQRLKANFYQVLRGVR
jgi:hypothetical protein